ncbi:hypothetical protein GN958_ATG17597 [Phytophthora infestans]|uniref:Uncharacterized protein n=1 Tax=Phytophthora infestans TaxID=4787 RepID=A0A8S9TWZ3_PHYIN|nr:hypothetical protein GN958_ATG17597 [Phytophthora infestans]
MSSFTNVPSESAQKPQQGVQRHSLSQILEHSSHSVCSAAPSLDPTHPETATSESFQSLVARSQVEVELDKRDESEEEKSCNNGVSVDYSSWKADEVRKECTRRGLIVKGNLKKDERITILMHHDMLQASIGSSTIDSTSVGARTRHCMYRLLDLLFSDEFATRFSQSGDEPSRAALDTREVIDRSCFWADVQTAFATTPSVTKALSAKKLFEMWKDVNKHYIVAEKKFTTSVQHENEFRNLFKAVDTYSTCKNG